MKQIDIIFTKSKKSFPIVSWGIMLWTGKDYSHVSRRIDNLNWGNLYYQASEGKVNYEHEDVFSKKHEIIKIIKFKVPSHLDDEIRKKCWQDAGKPYGVLQNLGIIIVDIFKNIGIKIRNPWKSGRNCSELVYTTVLVPLFGDMGYDPETIKPHHIDQILTTKGIELDSFKVVTY